MKKNNTISFIIVASVAILIVFTGVIYVNLLPNKESDSYYVKIHEELTNKIKSFDITNNILSIKTIGDNLEYCVKTTKTTPKENNVCWVKIEDGEGHMNILAHRTYYIFIKDEGGNISSYLTVNSDNPNME